MEEELRAELQQRHGRSDRGRGGTRAGRPRPRLVEQGVEVSQIQHYEGPDRVDGRGGRWNSFVFFGDPDGNQWAIQERPAE